MDRPELRAGDAERDETAKQLREHWALGRRVFLPGIAAFQEERRLRGVLRATYDSAWREMVPRLATRGYFVDEERSPLRLHFVSNSGHTLTVTFRPARDGGTVVTAFGHAPRAIRKAFATLRD